MDQPARPDRLQIERREKLGRRLVQFPALALFIGSTRVSRYVIDLLGLDSSYIRWTLDFALIGVSILLFFWVAPRVGQRFAERAARRR